MSELDFRFFDRRMSPDTANYCNFDDGSFYDHSEKFAWTVPTPSRPIYSEGNVYLTGLGAIPYGTGIILPQTPDESFTLAFNVYKTAANAGFMQLRVNATQSAQAGVTSTTGLFFSAPTWGEKVAYFSSLSNNNTWFNVVITYQKGGQQLNSNWKFYVDSVAGTTVAAANNNNNHALTVIGYYGPTVPTSASSPTASHIKKLDDFLIVRNRVFSEAEVRAFYEQTKKT